jgi:potassium uptake TrkH family protein
MAPLAVVAAGCLILEYGVRVSAEWAPFVWAAELSVVFFFVAETLLRIALGPHRSAYLRRHWIEAVLAGLFLINLLFLTRVIRWFEFPLETTEAAHRAYMILIQIYLVAVLILRALGGYLQKLVFSRFPPAQMVVITFASLVLVGTFMLVMPRSSGTDKGIPLIDALFTATSAVCVTGLVVLDTGRDFSLRGQAAILTLIQIGGLGIMTVTAISAILLGRGLGVRERAALRDVLNTGTMGSIVRTLSAILLVTVTTEALGAVLLYFFWGEPGSGNGRAYLAIFHSISAFCNAGISPLSNNLEGQRSNAGVVLTTAGLIITGGLGFVVVRDLFSPRFPNRRGFWNRLSLHSHLVLSTTCALLVGGTILIGIVESGRGVISLSSVQGWLDAFFQSVTARTAGFNTIPTGALTVPTVIIVACLMFVGASPGSTGGGIKTSTLAVLLAFVRSMVQNRADVEVGHRRIPDLAVRAAVSVFLLAIAWVVAATLILCITEASHLAESISAADPEFAPIDLLFEEVSAFGTVGLSRGVTPYLSAPGKLVIIFSMFLGRVGPLTLLLAIAQRKQRPEYKYPEENVMVG